MKRTMISRRARALTRLLFATGLLTAPAACTAILGGFDFDGPPEGGGGSGGSGGSSSSSSSSGSSSSSSGSVAACDDGKRNGDESDVDCGGSCPKCGDDQGCNNGSDCVSKVCTGGTCVAPTCTDTLENGAETDVDCGGPTCPKCPAEKGCGGDDDCVSGSCVGQVCASSCTDGVQDGDETDEDCGGASCPRCEVGGGCLVGPDCTSGLCESKVCESNYVWAKSFGDSADQSGTGVALDTVGNVYLTGTIKGSVDFGGGTLTVPTQQAISLAKLDPSGGHVWSKVFNSGPQTRAAAIGSLPDGGVAIIGTANSGINFGGGALTGVIGGNLFIAKLDAGGNHLWSRMLPGGQGVGLAVSGLGATFIVGGAGLNTIDLGCGALVPSGGIGIVIAALSKFNTCQWSRRLSGDADSTVDGAGIAVDASGNAVVMGTFAGNVDFGCGQHSTDPLGPAKLFVTKLDSAGACVWSKAFGEAMIDSDSTVEPAGVGLDDAGRVYVAGSYSGSFDPGGGPVAAVGRHDVFTLALDSVGDKLWFKHFGTPPMGMQLGGYNSTIGMAVGPTGRIALTGGMTANLDFGGGSLGDVSMFLAELDSSGNHVWSLGDGTSGGASGRSIAHAASGTLIVTGNFSGQVQFGGPAALTSVGSSDIFLAKLRVP